MQNQTHKPLTSNPHHRKLHQILAHYQILIITNVPQALSLFLIKNHLYTKRSLSINVKFSYLFQWKSLKPVSSRNLILLVFVGINFLLGHIIGLNFLTGKKCQRQQIVEMNII